MEIKEKTGVTPKALLNRPMPTRWSLEYWRAFQEISSSRQWTQAGPTGIPYLVKIAWLDENGVFDDDERISYLNVIQQLDNDYLKTFDNK